MRVLVTGATGYIGHAVARALLDAGHQVVALTHQRTDGLPRGVEPRTGDITDPASVRAAVHGVDAVCHLVGLARVRDSVSQPELYYQVNLTGTLYLLDALLAEARRTGIAARLAFASTGAVYGVPAEQPTKEGTPPTPMSPYAATKLAAEQAIGWHAATGLLGATTLRIFNAAGAVDGYGDPDLSRILPKAVAVAGGLAPQVEINGDGSALRDFVHVADIADAFVKGLATAEPGKARVYNVGATQASVADIIAATERVTGRPVTVEHRPANPNEAAVFAADTTLIRQDLGWTPQRSTIDQLVRDQWDAQQDRITNAY